MQTRHQLIKKNINVIKYLFRVIFFNLFIHFKFIFIKIEIMLVKQESLDVSN